MTASNVTFTISYEDIIFLFEYIRFGKSKKLNGNTDGIIVSLALGFTNNNTNFSYVFLATSYDSNIYFKNRTVSFCLLVKFSF
jgi:hypothetical protein